MAKYDAFISYSHSADGELAPKIRDGLQKLAKPWNKRRALNVFLDQASLEVSAGLRESLHDKLEGTKWLILLLSEDSARSEWVGAEIENWAATKPKDRIVLVHTDGELHWGDGQWDWDRSTAAPRALSGVFHEEPLWLDLRHYHDDANLDIRDNPAFKDDLATLAAPLHGKSKEDLVGEDLFQFRRAKRVRRASVVGLAVLTVVAVVAAVFAVQNAQEADRQRADAVVARDEAVAARDAETVARMAEEAARIAEEEQRMIAEEEARIANSRRLAAEALAELESRAEVEDNFPDAEVPAELQRRRSRALLLALNALSIELTGEALGSLAQGLLDGAGPEPIGSFLAGPSGGSQQVAFGPSGDIAAAGPNGMVHYWDSPGAASVLLDGSQGSGRDQLGHPVAFHPDGGLLASGGGGTVLLWDLTQIRSGVPVPDALPPVHSTSVDFEAAVQGLAFSADGQLLVTAGREGTVVLWDVATRAPVGDPLVAGRTLTSVAISDDRALVAATASGGWLHLWDITPAGETTGQVELPFLDGAVASGLDFGADRVVAASSWDHDQTLTVWDEPRERPDDVLTLTLQGEGFTAQGVAFGPDGTTLASAGQTVQVWDLADRQPIIDLLGHDGGVNSVAYGPDGTTLVSGGLFNSEVIAWDLSLEVLIELACREAGRNMTQREWDRFIGTDVAYERTCAAFDSGEGAPASAPVAQYTLPAP